MSGEMHPLLQKKILPPTRLPTFTSLDGVILQEMELFVIPFRWRPKRIYGHRLKYMPTYFTNVAEKLPINHGASCKPSGFHEQCKLAF
jgi:hypothetical protein